MIELKEAFKEVHEGLNRIEKIIADKIENKAPTGRFIDNGDNTITDTKTGLVWIKDHDVIDKKFAKRMIWNEAIEACKDLEYAGHKDWHLPTREELLTILDLTKYDPAIDPIFKVHTDDWYWSSTPCAWGLVFAWYVFFGNGYVYNSYKGNSGYVRPVRSSQ
jgi:hypothetical protein